MPDDQEGDETQIRDYWQPRVMKHNISGHGEYAIHEVYFNGRDGSVKYYSQHAFSPRVSSIEELKKAIIALLDQDTDIFIVGDLQFDHHREDIEDWLEYIDFPPFDYDAIECIDHEETD